jgi:hypothetical protein
VLPQHLRHDQRQVGRGRTLGQPPDELEADDLGRQHVDRLAEHDRLGLDAADAPADDAEPVDHRRVRVGADQRVGEHDLEVAVRPVLDAAREVLEVDLVDDARGRRDDLEVGERLLAPAQELVALAVALELDRRVVDECQGGVVLVDLDAVVDDEVDRDQRVDRLRIAPHPLHRAPQGGQVDDRRDAGEVLQDDASRLERHLELRRGRRIVGREPPDVVRRHVVAVLVPQQALEQDLDRERQPRDVAQPVLLELREAVVVRRPAARLEGGAGAEAVLGDERRAWILLARAAALGAGGPAGRRPAGGGGLRIPVCYAST